MTLKAGSVERLISSGVYPISSLIGWPPSSQYLHPAQSNALSSRAVLPVWKEEELHLGSKVSEMGVALQYADYRSLQVSSPAAARW